MKKEVIPFIFLIFSLALTINSMNVSSQIIINEIMPHANNSWNDEWIELYNPTNETLNLSQWKIGDLSSNDTLINLIIPSDNFALIVDSSTNKDNKTGCRAFNISNESCINLTTIGNGLNDETETLFLYNSQGNLIENFSWNHTIKSTGNSWNKNISDWSICITTPSSANNCSQHQENESKPENTTSTPKILITWPSQIWNNKTNFTLSLSLINFSTGFYDLKIDIKNGTQYRNRFWTPLGWSDKNSWILNFTSINSSQQNLSITSIIDTDNFFTGNATLQIKLRNLSREFESEIYNLTILNGTIQINQTNETGNNSNNPDESDLEKTSSIDIKDAPDSAKFGSTITLDLKIYRGNTGKYAVYAYVQDEDENKVSEKKTIHVDEKYSNYRDEIDLKLKCLDESGTYKIIVKGLDERDTKSIDLEPCNSITNDQTTSKTDNNEKENTSNDNSYMPPVQNIPQVNNLLTGSTTKTLNLESPSLSFLNILPYIMAIIIVILIIYVIIKL